MKKMPTKKITEKEDPSSSDRKKIVKFSKAIVVSILAAVAMFTVAMIILYAQFGGVPDTLVVAFFGFAGGEAGVLGFIKCMDTRADKKATKGSDAPSG